MNLLMTRAKESHPYTLHFSLNGGTNPSFERSNVATAPAGDFSRFCSAVCYRISKIGRGRRASVGELCCRQLRIVEMPFEMLAVAEREGATVA